MITVSYKKFNEVNESDFLALLNSHKIRKHLIEHELFTVNTLKIWINYKLEDLIGHQPDEDKNQVIFIRFSGASSHY